MKCRILMAGLAAALVAAPAGAQQRGTVEFGAFGSAASFDRELSLKTGYGGGGRVGVFLTPSWSLEFEDAEMRASRPNGLENVNVGLLSGRVVAVPVRRGRLSLLLGAGAGVSTETNFLHSYGVDGLVGAKMALNDNVALRVDGVWDWLANEDWKTYRSLRVGLSLYRHADSAPRVGMVSPPAPRTMSESVTTMAPRPDSVSSAETRRLRDREAELRALRDSLRSAPPRSPISTAALPAQAVIHFAFDESVLSDAAKATIDSHIGAFRANPALTIAILGHTDVIGTGAYNEALGARRANAAKAYIVGLGIPASRVVIESRGETQPLTQDSGRAGQAPNRRATFQLQIASDAPRPQG